MKKIKIALWIASVFSLGAISIVGAVPSFIYQRTILPQINGGFNLGSTSYKWNKIWGNYVSSTAMSADTVCIGTDCQTAWPAGATPEFTFTTNYGRVVATTSTNPLFLPLGLSASSTSYFVNASSTNYTALGKYWGDGTELTLDSVGSPTINNIQDFMNLNSAGIKTGGTISLGSNYTINVSASEGTIAIGPLATDPLVFYATAASSSIYVVPSSTMFVGISYNGGNPVVVTSSLEENFTYQDTFPIGEVVRENNIIHITQNARIIADAPGQLIRRFHQTLPYARDELVGGLVLGETGTRNITLSAGYLWDRSNRFTISATSTATGGFFDAYYRDSGSGFIAVYDQTQWDNDSYDNGSGTLQAVAANRYANLWWYLETDGGVVMLYGRALYTTAAAASAGTPPATLPVRLQYGARLIARTTFQGSAATFLANDSVWANQFTASAVTNHANLTNLDYASAGHTGFAGTGLTIPQAITYVSSTAIGATGYVSSTQGYFNAIQMLGDITPNTSATRNLGSASLLFKNFYTSYSSSTIASDVGTVLSGVWNGTVIDDAYLTKSGDWTGTIDGNNFAGGAIGTGELLYGGGAGSIAELGVGTNGNILAQLSGIPAWISTSTFLFSTGGTGTGVWDFGGATSFEIPNSANPTVDATGEIAIDTTVASSSLKYYDGTAERALYDVEYKTFTWSTSTMESAEGLTASTTIPIGVSSPQGETWVSIECYTSAGTVEVEFGDGTAFMDYQKLTTSVSRDTSLSNNTFVMSEKRYIRVGRASSLGYGSCTAGIRENP